jgi:hypothetical protein
MKKPNRSFNSLLIATIFLTTSFSLKAQIFVEIRPVVPVIVRPPQPSPVYIWVNEEWEAYGKTYRYAGGHWVQPPRPGYYYRNGYWAHSKKGQKWVKGSWSDKKHSNNGNHFGQQKKKKPKGKH